MVHHTIGMNPWMWTFSISIHDKIDMAIQLMLAKQDRQNFKKNYGLMPGETWTA